MSFNKIAEWVSALSTKQMLDLPFLFARKDLEQRFIDATGPMLKLKGVNSIEQLVGKRAGELPCTSADFDLYFEKADMDCISENRIISQISMYDNPNGVFSAFLIKRSPLYTEAGEIYGSMFETTDITSLPIIMQSKWQQQKNAIVKDELKAKGGKIFEMLPDDKFLNLSRRETEILFFYVRGYSSTQIATMLGIKNNTAISYIDNMKTKLECNSKAQVIERAISLGFMNYMPMTIMHDMAFAE